MDRWSKVALLVLTVFISAVVTFPTPAQAKTITITFDTGTLSQPTYTESGMTVTSLAWGLPHLQIDDFDLDGDNELLNGDFTAIRFDFGGSPFSVMSLEVVYVSGPEVFSHFNTTKGSERVDALGTHTNPPHTNWTAITAFYWLVPSYFWAMAIDNLVVQVGPPVAPFNSLDTKLEIDDDEFEAKGTFTLGEDSDGIDPVAEEVTITVGTYTVTIPADSFRWKKGKYTFNEDVDGVELVVKIKPLGGGTFKFKIVAEDADLSGTANPVEVTLTIGDDAGTVSVYAKMDE